MPGLVVYVTVYTYWIASGQRFDPFMNWEDPVQTLNSDVLLQMPIQSLMGQHAQPPLFMTIKLIGLQFGDHQVAFWQILWFAAFALGLIAIVGSLLCAGVSPKLTALLGAGYVVVPGTAKYALWGYTTVLVSTLLALVVFGLALLWIRSRWGVPLTCLSILLLVSLRSYFIWALGLALLGLVAYRLIRSCSLRILPLQWGFLILAVLGVVGLQYHYWSSFGLTSMSSLGPSNLNRGLLAVGLSEGEKAALAASDACLADVIAAGPFSSAAAVPNCRFLWVDRDLSTTEAAEMAEIANSLDRLQGSFAQQYFFAAAIKQHPNALARQFIGPDPAEGALGSYLGTTAGLTGVALGVQSLLPVASIVVILIALAALVATGSLRSPPGWIWVALALLILQTGAAIWGEFPENLRIRAEGHSLLFLVPLLLLSALWKARKDEGVPRKTEARSEP